MTDFEKFQKFFDEIGIEYETHADTDAEGGVLYIDSFEVDGIELEQLVIKFYDDGEYQEFSAYPVPPNFVNPKWRNPTKLKPCPFCGGKPYHHSDKYNVNPETKEDCNKVLHFIMCSDCPALTSGETEEIARKRWNHRIDIDKIVLP